MAADAEGWIEWGGGECPIPPGSKFQYRLRDGGTGAPLTTASAWEWRHHNSPYDIVAYRFAPANSDAEGEWVKKETLDRLRREITELREALDCAKRETWANVSGTQIWMDLEADRDNSNALLDECRHERNVLLRICAERAFKIERCHAALSAIRAKALPAGAAIGLRREDWEARCCEVLDIIDAALVEATV